MFKLTLDELQSAFEAIEYHGYSALLPTPPEWSVVQREWQEIKQELAAIDLDNYRPATPLRVYAPKNRATVRVVSLLHPIDLIIYTALTLLVKDDLEGQRLPPNKKIVHSYRTELGVNNRLYSRANSYREFQLKIEERSRRVATQYVAIADIADFYPRIYQHRLQNAVEAAATTPRSKEVARVLAKKNDRPFVRKQQLRHSRRTLCVSHPR